MRRSRVLLPLLAGSALAIVCVGWALLPVPALGAPALLATGDTGQPPDARLGANRQRLVAKAMERSHREAPVSGLVLLGDNFYPDGLREREFKDRLRFNVVRPYCIFMRFTQRGEGSMEEACPLDPDERLPVPVYAVLGNHDYKEKESPLLQRKRIPEYLDNWTMPGGLVDVVELGGGVSLILLQSMEIVHGDSGADLRRALAESRGPWRILAAHHPLVDPGRGYDRDYARLVQRIVGSSGVPVQLYLAGHEHNLQAFRGEGAVAGLHLVIGSGGDIRELSEGDDEPLYAAESLGFARIELVSDGAETARLRAVVYEVSGGVPGFGVRKRPAAAFSVGIDGDVRVEEAR